MLHSHDHRDSSDRSGQSADQTCSNHSVTAARGVEEVTSWQLVLLTFMKKKAMAVSLEEQFRGISLLHAGLKWCLSCIVLMAKERDLPADMRDVLIVGGSEGFGTDWAHVILMQTQAKGEEWSDTPGLEAVWELEGDILRAYDNLTPNLLFAALLAAGVHPKLCAALAEEAVDLMLEPRVDSVRIEEEVRVSR